MRKSTGGFFASILFLLGVAPAEEHFVYVLKSSRPNLVSTLSETESAQFVAHGAYLKRLQSEGHVILAAACKDGAFGMVILQAENEAEALLLMRQDPIVESGLLIPDFHALYKPMMPGAP